MAKRDTRQDNIRNIVRQHSVKTQQEIVYYLMNLGQTCTQATISRDINELGLKKAEDGTYILPEDLTLNHMVSNMVESAAYAGNLVVVKCLVGTASGIAAAFDDVGFDNVLGTIAGDDTILVVCQTESTAELFVDLVERMRSSNTKTIGEAK